MAHTTYLVFGDLHGRILPAFRLSLAWQREHGERVAALLQVGDLGFFPDPARLDRATRRHAERDPLELGASRVASPSPEADDLFAEPDLPDALWFTCGNHEDYEALEALAHGPGSTRDDFPADAYGRVRCVRDGHVATLPGGLRVGALWGVDDQAPDHRRHAPARGRISPRRADVLSALAFDVLLTHDCPRDAVHPDSGSDAVLSLVRRAQPAFAFFGHYHGVGELAGDFGATQVFHLEGLEFRGRDGFAEERSVGVLRWEQGPGGTFAHVEPEWLRTVTRHNWKHR